MNNQFSKQDLNKFIASLLRGYSDSIDSQIDIPPSPYFMTQVQTRIRAKQASYFWETGIVRAQRWLVAFSLIALIFFVSNLVFTNNASMSSTELLPDVLALTDHDWDHINDEPLLASETIKQ